MGRIDTVVVLDLKTGQQLCALPVLVPSLAVVQDEEAGIRLLEAAPDGSAVALVLSSKSEDLSRKIFVLSLPKVRAPVFDMRFALARGRPRAGTGVGCDREPWPMFTHPPSCPRPRPGFVRPRRACRRRLAGPGPRLGEGGGGGGDVAPGTPKWLYGSIDFLGAGGAGDFVSGIWQGELV